MPDESNGDLALLVVARLEGKQRQHPIDRAMDFAQTVAAPRPYRGTDVMYRRNAGRAQALLDGEIEVGRIDADIEIRRFREKVRGQTAGREENAREPGDPFEPADR